MKSTSLVCLLLIALSFAGCSKSGDHPAPASNFSTLPDHLFEVDTTKMPFDTMMRRFFRYDGSNRLVFDSAVQKSRYDGSLSYYTTEIHYQGTDTVASWSTSRNWTPTRLPYIDTTYYTFVNGVYTKDSIHFDARYLNQTAEARNRFTYGPGMITRDFQNWLGNINYTATEHEVVHFTLADGQINYLIDSLTGQTNGQNQAVQIFETYISYRPQPNPLYRVLLPVSVPVSYYMGLGEQPGTRYRLPAKLLAEQHSADAAVSYSYQLRSDGYPLTAIRKEQYASNPISYWKLVFVYR